MRFYRSSYFCTAKSCKFAHVVSIFMANSCVIKKELQSPITKTNIIYAFGD